MNENDVSQFVAPAVGLKCSGRQLYLSNRLCLDFGNLRYFKLGPKRIRRRREWRVFSYSAAWRIVQDGRIVLASDTIRQSKFELEEALMALELGAFCGIERLSPFDVRLVLSNQTWVDFLHASTDDEMLEIVHTNFEHLTWDLSTGWKILK